MLLSKSAPLLSSSRSSTTVSGDDRGDGDDVLNKAGEESGVVPFIVFNDTTVFVSSVNA